MEPLIAPAVLVAYGLGVRAIATIDLFLRLRWRVKQEHAHYMDTKTLARGLPAGCCFEETRSDGSRVSLKVPLQSELPEGHG